MGLVRGTSAGSLDSVIVSAPSAACQSAAGGLFCGVATNTRIKIYPSLVYSSDLYR
jgi:hypothetical protein